MYYLLYLFYLSIFIYYIPRISFVKKTGIHPRTTQWLFLTAALAGILIGWISQRYYPGNDYWNLNKDAKIEFELLKTDPREFFANIVRSPYTHGYSGFFNSVGSYWNDLRYNILLKILALLGFLSGGDYYVNSLFFNLFKFLGVVALYRVYSTVFPQQQKAVMVACFLLPSTIYFSSGIHKDLVVFALLGFYCYGLFFSARNEVSAKRISMIILSFAGILLMRNYVAICLLPPTLAFLLSQRSKLHPALISSLLYGALLIGLAILEWAQPNFQPLKVITQKQLDFLDLPTATSELAHFSLSPSLKSFFVNFPIAFQHGFLRPFFWESRSFLFLLSLELLLYQVLAVFFLVRLRINNSRVHSFVWFGLFFAFTLLLLTGYIIPNEGSIVRYRSIYLPFLVCPLLAGIFDKHINFKNM